ncbi:U1 zinc finger domain-containing protein [Phlyctema vagabunda]|uniref:U1 zinc finger domain-containing protein n=1 Tax=Phlyctema vagabunda TaxID=108571 RepID=A0ABR4PBZ0_9HELO
MSEYWKSTPKYWCKHCKTFIRDTKFERTNHDATPKHQGNLKRFLRDLHRGHEKDEKDKERAKAEVARLNGVVAGGSSSGNSAESSFGRGPTPSVPRQAATAAQIIQQREQLSEMGIAIPDEFRKEMTMVGEWEVTSERIIDPDEQDKKPDSIGFGVRKRPAEEEEEEATQAKKARWGSAYRTHPDVDGNGDGDLEALLNNATRKGKETAVNSELKVEPKEDIKREPREGLEVADPSAIPPIGEPGADKAGLIKNEPLDEDHALPGLTDVGEKSDGLDQAAVGVVFKKRKTKNIRQK